ncbi:putative molybdopterin binding domain family protein [Candida parapsilosis]|uniref:MoCF_biosynth domain-containing protein n=2 Tax=Candida parapsilosis TaxID=5480 RepID=G8B4W9_CANPC|nr:uncharacterized protein CPAR2_600770 [Candida parapsilosis]KAF6043676.1 putative molybdopterin binding domain family protein [Candida parapsilosis]KAF6043827.1 putative molybdopterin binding domain family protein [Candida parapsilosis]KAF6045554.1 putative molybdopterin binding domain family protein [Candida parapsilosis]KAF6060340.1 putative molybdopterin binding domain family protein [Candida parapsilosis]KAI5905448.1 Uncharacterized protein K4G60_g4707 [Candida parapsilosis]
MTISHKPIKTAGCLIIGDEILNGKIMDTNSYNFARFCFNDLSIPLKRTVVCGDDSQDIKTSLHNLLSQDNVGFLVTSGGLGSTHDDITYEAISDYFKLDYKLDQEVVDRMQSLRKDYLAKLDKEQLDAFYRMATLPTTTSNAVTTTATATPTTTGASSTASGFKVEKIYANDKMWFPIVVIDERVFILPGVPQLFVQCLPTIKGYLQPRLESIKLIRRYVVTKTGESQLAPYLGKLQTRCNEKFGNGVVKLGSYPHLESHLNTISVIGNGIESKKDLDWVVDDLLNNVNGHAKEISQEEEDEFT